MANILSFDFHVKDNMKPKKEHSIVINVRMNEATMYSDVLSILAQFIPGNFEGIEMQSTAKKK